MDRMPGFRGTHGDGIAGGSSLLVHLRCTTAYNVTHGGNLGESDASARPRLRKTLEYLRVSSLSTLGFR